MHKRNKSNTCNERVLPSGNSPLGAAEQRSRDSGGLSSLRSSTCEPTLPIKSNATATASLGNEANICQRPPLQVFDVCVIHVDTARVPSIPPQSQRAACIRATCRTGAADRSDPIVSTCHIHCKNVIIQMLLAWCAPGAHHRSYLTRHEVRVHVCKDRLVVDCPVAQVWRMADRHDTAAACCKLQLQQYCEPVHDSNGAAVLFSCPDSSRHGSMSYIKHVKGIMTGDHLHVRLLH